ncbi:MAG: helix-turn-helix domain-containing protein [Rhodocyclales bacterium]|nr:helix-turn-helix domain-containing protein [Rhodocyclales bacterium]
MPGDNFPEPVPDEASLLSDRHLPGAVLRATREARGLSVSDVAQAIRFSVRQIDALECDDYSGFPSTTLLRGFIRSYAKFLKIDAESLLALLEPTMPTAADVRPPDNFGAAEQPGWLPNMKAKLLLAGLLVLIVLAVVLRFIPLESGSVPPMPIPPPKAAVPLVTTAPASTVVPAVPALPAVPVPAAPASAGTLPPAVSPGGAAAPLAVAPPSPMVASGLRVELTDRSWIEVRDATQTVVLSGEFPAGTRQNVAGKPPFQIWIGKAAGVRVFMGERNIDLQPYTRAEVARLTVE